MRETEAYLKRITDTLDTVAATKLVWSNGFANRGGPHRRLVGNQYPISIGEDECELFGKVIAGLRPKNCFIVGNAFGFSSAFIALAMQDHGGQSVITLDAQSEGLGERNAQVARELTERLSLTILKNKKGYSPWDVPAAVEDAKYDLIFLDGCHSHPDVMYDLLGAVPYAHEESVIALHDFWLPGVQQAAVKAESSGFHCLLVRTSCEIVLCTRSAATFARLRELFPNGVTEVGKHYRGPKYMFRYLTTLPEVLLSAAVEKFAANPYLARGNAR